MAVSYESTGKYHIYALLYCSLYSKTSNLNSKKSTNYVSVFEVLGDIILGQISKVRLGECRMALEMENFLLLNISGQHMSPLMLIVRYTNVSACHTHSLKGSNQFDVRNTAVHYWI